MKLDKSGPISATDIPLRVELASRILAAWHGKRGKDWGIYDKAMPEAGWSPADIRSYHCKRALKWADALIEAHDNNPSMEVQDDDPARTGR